MYSLLLNYVFPTTLICIPCYCNLSSLLLLYVFPTTAICLPCYFIMSSLLLHYIFPAVVICLPYYYNMYSLQSYYAFRIAVIYKTTNPFQNSGKGLLLLYCRNERLCASIYGVGGHLNTLWQI